MECGYCVGRRLPSDELGGGRVPFRYPLYADVTLLVHGNEKAILFAGGISGAWMRLRFAISGHAPKEEAKDQSETKQPAAATNTETTVEAATGN